MLRLVQDSHARGSDNAHERAFLLRHDTLLACARRLAGQDSTQADDLLQDAFLQFTLARPDLTTIENLDGYLVRLLRNLHLSTLRHEARRQQRLVSIPDFDSASIALAGLDPEQRLQARDDLYLVCRYVCVRKTQSKSASVLAFRFFLGFYQAEIAALLRTTTGVVNRWLWQARVEARQFLVETPHCQRLWVSRCASEASTAFDCDDPEEILHALRTTLRASNDSSCPTTKEVRAMYARRADERSVSTAWLAHLVSCKRCLDATSDVLKLPPPARRDPPGRPPGSEGSGSRAAGRTALDRRSRNGQRDVHEHRPKTLRVSVNGIQVGELAVESARSRVRWALRPEEPVAFVEAHSEQGLRMAWLMVAPPPEGDVTQATQIMLSESRSLWLAIDFTQIPPSIALEYLDPAPPLDAAVVPLPPMEKRDTGTQNERLPLMARLRAGVRFWPRLALAGLALVAGLGLLAWSMTGRRPAVPTVAAVLEQAARSTPPPSPGRVHHQALRFEVRMSSSPTPLRRYRVDIWTSTGPRAIRVSDDAGHLIAGQWQTAGSIHTLPLGLFDDVWTSGLSVSSFAERHADAGARCQTTADDAEVQITCERSNQTSWFDVIAPTLLAAQADRPSSAVLVLRRSDLHPVALRLAFGPGSAASYLSLEEEQFSDLAANAVPAATFEAPMPARSTAVTPRPTASTRPEATVSLEVRVAEILDRGQGNDQLAVAWTAERRLRVTGLVESEARRREVVADLERLSDDGAIAISIATYDELRVMEARGRRTTGEGATRVEILELPSGPPALTPYFAARMDAKHASTLLRDLSPRVVAEARTARLHATKLLALLEEYPEAGVDELAVEGRVAWRSLLARRAALAAAALASLDRLLESHFELEPDDTPTTPNTITEATRRCSHEVGVLESAVTTAFTAQPEGVSLPDESVPKDFRRHLRRALSDARFIESRLRP
jgi:RNA polymerase sigma factor (sigma-70 family)